MNNIFDLAGRTRFGNDEGYSKGVHYKEVLENRLYQSYFNGVVLAKKQLGQDSTTDKPRVTVKLEVPKIPFKYYLMVLDFYKDINELYKTEASVLFYWNYDNLEIPAELFEKYQDGIVQDGQLVVFCPKQTGSAARSTFSEPVPVGSPVGTLAPTNEMVQWFETNMVGYLETHSHNTMDAFWSSTDDDNEAHNMLRMFAVIGKVETEEQMLLRICYRQQFYKLNPSTVFEFPKIETVNRMELINGEVVEHVTSISNERTVYPNNSTYPPSWMNMFTKEQVVTQSYINPRFYNSPSKTSLTNIGESREDWRAKTNYSQLGSLDLMDDEAYITATLEEAGELFESFLVDGLEISDAISELNGLYEKEICEKVFSIIALQEGVDDISKIDTQAYIDEANFEYESTNFDHMDPSTFGTPVVTETLPPVNTLADKLPSYLSTTKGTGVPSHTNNTVSKKLPEANKAVLEGLGINKL